MTSPATCGGQSGIERVCQIVAMARGGGGVRKPPAPSPGRGRPGDTKGGPKKGGSGPVRGGPKKG